VREGFKHVTGDIIGIQDGDLEYRVEDYPKLLQPILDNKTNLVLGTRHVPGQPMRQLGSAFQSKMVNAAHWGFTGLFNIFYGTRLTDPFTMYKIFRAECIEGLELVSNRFDFDWELLGKLVRRGYTPTEIGITYVSRSFEDGKKVRFIRDPLTWFVACARFRFAKIAPAIPVPPLPVRKKAEPANVTSGETAVPV
jgi:hypothetical protein